MRAGYNHPDKSYFRTIGRWASIAALIGSSILGCSKKPEKTPEERAIDGLRAKVTAQNRELNRLKPFESEAGKYKKQAEGSQATAAQQQEQLNQNQEKIQSLESEVERLRKDQAMIEHLQKEFSELDAIRKRLQESQQEQENLQDKIRRLEEQHKKVQEEGKKALAFRYRYEGHISSALSFSAHELWNEAANELNQAIVLNPTEISLHYFAAVCHENNGKLEEAKREFENVLTLNKDHDPAKTRLEAVQQKILDQETLKKEPQDAFGWYDRGEVQLKKGVLDEAVKAFGEAIALNQNEPIFYLSLGRAHIEKGDREKAFSTFEEGIKKNPSKNDVSLIQDEYVKRAKTQEEIAHGIEFFLELSRKQKTEGADSTISKLHMKIGDLFFGVYNSPQDVGFDLETLKSVSAADKDPKALDSAISAFENAIKYDPKWRLAHCRLGEALLEKGEADKAMKKFNEAIKLDLRWSRPHFNIARHHRTRSTKTAYYAYRKAIDLDPSNEAQSEYVELLKQINSLSSGRGFFRDLIRKFPQSKRLKQSLAEVYMGLRDWDISIFVLEKNLLFSKYSLLKEAEEASDFKPGDDVLHLYLGRCYREKSLLEKAKKSFGRALEINPESQAKIELETIIQHEKSLKLWDKLSPAKKRVQEDFDIRDAQKLLDKEEWNSVIWLLEKYRDSKNVQVSEILGQAYLNAGRFDKAKEELKKARKKDTYVNSLIIKIFKGRKARLEYIRSIYRDYGESLEFNLTLFELYQEARDALPFKGFLYHFNKKSISAGEKLAAIFERLELAEEEPKGFLEKAVEVYEKIHGGEKLAEIYKRLAIRYQNKDVLEKAIKTYEESLSKATSSTTRNRCHLALGQLKRSRGDLEQALEHFKSMKNSTEIAKTASELGKREFQGGNTDKAIEYYETAIKYHATHETYYELGKAYKKDGNSKKAEYYFRRAVKSSDTKLRAKVYFKLGMLYYGNFVSWKDDHDHRVYSIQLNEAREHLELAIRYNPKLKEAHFNLGIVYAESKCEDFVISPKYQKYFSDARQCALNAFRRADELRMIDGIDEKDSSHPTKDPKSYLRVLEENDFAGLRDLIEVIRFSKEMMDIN
jgi:tetratricopeptide (TPR) repeat protein